MPMTTQPFCTHFVNKWKKGGSQRWENLLRVAYLIISSSVVPFSSCPQSFPASGSFPTSRLFTSGGQSIGDSASAQSFQWTSRTDLLKDGLVGSPCSPRDSQDLVWGYWDILHEICKVEVRQQCVPVFRDGHLGQLVFVLAHPHSPASHQETSAHSSFSSCQTCWVSLSSASPHPTPIPCKLHWTPWAQEFLPQDTPPGKQESGKQWEINVGASTF